MPVHLKGGTVDALLYRTTMTLTVLGEKIPICFKLHHLFPAELFLVKAARIVTICLTPKQQEKS